MATTARTARTKAAAPAPEVEPDEDFEELEDETGDDDLEEMEDGDEDSAEAEADEKPKAKRTPPQRPKIEFGSPWLAAHVTEKTGETFDARSIRMLLRKLAKDGKLKREVGVTRERYEFSGPNDPIVKSVVAMINSGEAKAMKQEGLQKVKDNAAAKKAAAKAAKEKAAEDEMESVEDEDDIEDDIEDEAPAAPAPKRRTATKTAAPAKATPATRRRAATPAK
jgi:hypothetical protein